MAIGTGLLGSPARADDPDGVQVHVEIVGARVDPEIKAVQDEVEAAVREGVGPANEAGPSAKTLLVFVSPMPSAPAGDFLVRIVAVAYGESVGETEPYACMSCGAAELTRITLQQLPPLLDQLAAVEPPPPLPAVSAPIDPEPEQVVEPPVRRHPNGRALTIAGATTAVVGAALLGVGGTMLGVGRVFPDGGEGELFVEVVDYRPAGAALTAIGGAALVAGVVCFGLGVRNKSNRMSMTPVLTRHGVGGHVVLAF